MKLKNVATFSGKGKRPDQEDCVLVQKDRGIVVVADGFGGPLAGPKASQAACEAIQKFLIKEAGDLEATLPFVIRSYFSLAGNVLFNALIHANRKVNLLNKGKDVHEKGGASTLAAFLDGDLLAIANVGCCSAWMFRQGKSVELVIPRTYGKLYDPFSTEHEKEKQVPLSALGFTEDLEPEIFEYRVQEGDWIIFHTDGLRAAQREEVLSIQNKGLQTQESANEVMRLLDQSDFEDNLAFSLVIF